MAKTESSSAEQTGYHKGSLETLTKERAELQRILQIVEQLMRVHVDALKDLGVDLEKEAKELKQKKDKKPIDELF